MDYIDKTVRPGAFADLEVTRNPKQECFRQERLKHDDSYHIGSQSYANKKKPPRPEQATGEIFLEFAPGVKEKLRLSHESVKAIETGFYTPTVCWGCCAGLYCISDAAYLICPACTVISPLEESLPTAHGIGMAFTKETLDQVEKELAGKDHIPSSMEYASK